MEKGKNTPQEDITKQRYKGPSAYVAALGEGAMQTKFLTLGGLLVGGVAAFLAPKEAAKIIESAQKAVDGAAVSQNGFKKFGGKLGKVTLSFGKEMSDFFTEIGFIKNHLGRMNKARIATAIDGAIFTSAVASVIGIFSGGGAGIASARAGRKQFETAKEEVLTLRLQLAQKDNQIADLKTVHAAKKGALKVASDEIHTDTETAEKSAQDETATKTSYAESQTKPQANWSADIASQNTAKAEAQLAL